MPLNIVQLFAKGLVALKFILSQTVSFTNYCLKFVLNSQEFPQVVLFLNENKTLTTLKNRHF